MLMILFVWSIFRILQARTDLNSARAHLISARGALTDRDASLAGEQAAAAARYSASARGAVDDPAVQFFAAVPVLGRSFQAVRGIAKAADETVKSVVLPLVKVVQILNPDQLRRPDGSINLALFEEVQPTLDVAASRSEAITKEANALPRLFLPHPVGHASSQFRKELTDLNTLVQKAALGVRIAPDMLGASKPQRYFVMLQQAGESRGTGGLIGGYAVLTADHGRFKVEAEGTDKDLANGSVAPSPDLPRDFVEDYRYSGTFDIWQNVNISPDLPNVAKVVRDRWKNQTGRVITGVIAVDATSLADLLHGHAPLILPGRTVPISDLQHYLAIDQYADTADPIARKDKLTAVAHDVLQQLVAGGGASVDLLKGADSALRSGHLRVASLQSGTARSLQRLGIDGGIPRGIGPVAYAVVNNGAGSKLDYFLDRTISYHANNCRDGRRDSVVKVTLTNHAPPVQTLPAYVTSHLVAGTPSHSSTNRVLLTVYATHGTILRSARLDGQAVSAIPGRTLQQLDAGTEAGLPYWSLSFDLPPDKPVSLSLQLSEPRVSGAARVPTQPGSRPLMRDVSWQGC